MMTAFLLWSSGHQFLEGDLVLIVIGLSLLMGLKMGFTGSIAGAVLSVVFAKK
jgi:hypothetical protein